MAKSYEEMVAEAREATEQADVDTVHEAVESEAGVTVVDVREPEEYEAGHVPGAKLIPRGLLELKSSEELPDKDARIVVHCALGGRGALAAKTLQEMGYSNVINMQGGITAWKEHGFELE